MSADQTVDDALDVFDEPNDFADEAEVEEDRYDDHEAEELVLGEDELQAMCARLLARAGESADEDLLAAHPALADELARRLNAVGARLVRARDQAPLVVVSQPSEELTELALACLSLCALDLAEDAEDAGKARRRPRVTVQKIWEAVGKPRGYSEAYVRRAGLGPLEARQMIKIVKPEQRAGDAYIVSGPALRAIDVVMLRRRLTELRNHRSS
jgi:hypothetical protein